MSYLLLFLVSLVFSGIFSGFEIAFVTIDRGKLLLWFRGRMAEFLLRRPHEVITAILIGNNLANITAVVSVTELVQRWIPSGVRVVPLAGLISTVAILLFGEIIPKALFRAYAPWAVRGLAPLVYGFYLMSWPAVKGLGSAVQRLLGSASEEGKGRWELEKVVLSAQKAGTLDAQEAEFLFAAFNALEQRVTAFMEPREGLMAFPVTFPAQEALRRARESGYRRFLVYKGTLDKVLGYVHIKDLLLATERSSIPQRIIRPAAVVFENWTLMEALQAMQRQRTPVAVVVDEYGGTVGALWITRVLDTLLQKQAFLKRQEVVMSLETPLPQVRERLGVDLGRTRADTLGGFLAERLGRVPRKGDQVAVEGWVFEVIEVGGTGVKQVLARRKDAQSHDAGKTVRPGGRNGPKRGTPAGGRPPGDSPS